MIVKMDVVVDQTSSFSKGLDLRSVDTLCFEDRENVFCQSIIIRIGCKEDGGAMMGACGSYKGIPLSKEKGIFVVILSYSSFLRRDLTIVQKPAAIIASAPPTAAAVLLDVTPVCGRLTSSAFWFVPVPVFGSIV